MTVIINSISLSLNSPKGKIDYVISVNSMERNPRVAKKFPTRYGTRTFLTGTAYVKSKCLEEPSTY